MSAIQVNVRLYAGLSCYGKVVDSVDNHSTIDVELPAGSTMKDLLDYLLMCTNERGFTFINEQISAIPDVQPDLDYRLQRGDQIIFFPLKMIPTGLHFNMNVVTDTMSKTVRADEDPSHYYLYE